MFLVAPAWAQTNGDVRDGDDVQPSSREVHAREAAERNAPAISEEAREAATVDQLYQQLTGKERSGEHEPPLPNTSSAASAVRPPGRS